MPRRTMVEAIRDAMDVAMQRDENVVVFGEDVGYFGGVFRCTQGLQQKYGASRCFDTPISELAMLAAAAALGASGFGHAAGFSSAAICSPPMTQSVRRPAALGYGPPARSARR